MLTCCCWNLRGLGQAPKCADVLSELLSINPHAVFIQETKLDSIDKIKAHSFLPKQLTTYHSKPSSGSCGGILNAFSQAHFSIQSQSTSDFTLTSVVTCLASPTPLYLTNVYAPTDHHLKSLFLDHLASIAPPPNCPWMLLGDFNLMRSPEDKNNPSFRFNEADLFNDTIDQLALIELPLLDRSYT